MTKLIDELKQEHAVLMDILDEVYRLGIASKEAQSKLGAAKAGLLRHLRREDEHLYPALKTACAGNPEVSDTVRRFIADMGVVSREALVFFDKYSAGGAGGAALEFARDFGRFSVTLKSRIQREETTLYRIYEKAASA
ncbi:MAG: hemerythrin domain-containing protein [Deltaproteobacteria bacterium]|nr:hemerythrin domain-containing protein [Deltaproteobacteria bacterium]